MYNIRNNFKNNIKIINIFLVFCIAIILTGCSSDSSNVTGNLVSDSGSSSSNSAVVQSIEIKGSDTMLQLMSSLAEKYKLDNSNAKISVTGGGSGTGIASLINREVDIAASSRKIKSEEMKKAQDNGAEVVELIVARDQLSVVVNPNNKVSKLTIEEISKIYRGEITNWKELGGEDKEITLYGRQSTSGTYIYFMEDVVKGDYSPEMKNMEGSQAIIEAVEQDKTGIGYVGVGYLVNENAGNIERIKAIDVAKTKDSEYYSSTDASNIDNYPISRVLYLYLSETPSKDSEVYNFLKFILSINGQEVVVNSGFIELNEKEISSMTLILD